jgi:oligoribonuclease NrnB/cAMP/cGMP phosphodiesterase (DHH superfamily)
MKPYKLFTHTDMDGAGCAILANIAFKNNVDIEYIHNPKELTESLIKMGNEYKEYETIYVTDCSFDVEKVNEENPKVLNHIKLFDHHKTAVEPFKEYKWAKVEPMLNNRLTCGTELFYQYLLNKGLITNRDFFVEQVRLYDTWDYSKYPSQIPKYLSSMVFKLGLQYTVNTFSQRLAKKDLNELTLFNEYERIILAYETEREAKDIDNFMKLAYIGKVENEGKEYSFCLVYNNGLYTSFMGNKICIDYNVDIAFLINLNKDIVGVRSTRTDIDLGAIMKQFYNGGGHPQASGGSIEGIAEQTAKDIVGKMGTVTSINKVEGA